MQTTRYKSIAFKREDIGACSLKQKSLKNIFKPWNVSPDTIENIYQNKEQSHQQTHPTKIKKNCIGGNIVGFM